jgi:hypothetical protein
MYMCIYICMQYKRKYKRNFTTSVRKVTGHFEYLQNLSRGLGVTRKPVRGEPIAYP